TKHLCHPCRMAGVADLAYLLTWIRSRPKAQSNPARAQITGGNIVNKAIRWRIVSLQAMLVIILMGASGFLFYEGSFVTGMVKDELTAQQVFFPAADQIKAGGALDPAEFPQEIRDQAGNQVTDGNQARIYAQDFLGKHLQTVAGGSTYASIGTKISGANAALEQTPNADPHLSRLAA